MRFTLALYTMASTALHQTTKTAIKTQKINKYMLHICNEATTSQTKPVAILFAWLMAQEKHFTRYIYCKSFLQ